MKIIFYISLFFLMLHNNISADEMDFSKEFYNDISGYHAVGKNISENKDEAFRLAKSTAIKRIFREIGKDELFQQMFISIQPQFIVVEGYSIEESENNFNVTIKVLIDQNAIILMEPQYSEAVYKILTKADSINYETEQFIQDAENAELNLRMSEAVLFYRSAKLRCREIDELLKNINDSSIRSENGNNILVIEKITNTLFSRASQGYQRLEELEIEIEKDSNLEELVKTLELLIIEIENIKGVVYTYSDLQPFYDIPKSRLENIKIEVQSGIEKSNTINEKITFLSSQIPQERILLKEKVGISIDELELLLEKLKKMKKDVDHEIRDPRLARQQRAQNWNNFLKGTTGILKYIFLHESQDLLAIRFFLPFEWSVDSGPLISENSEFNLRVEKTFYSGFWIKTQFSSIGTTLLNENVNKSINQELALGYFRERLLFGAGMVWDWNRKVNDSDIEKDNRFKIYFGGIDNKRSRANWLLSFSYQFPHFIDPFLPAYQLNAALDLLIRIENILLLETSVLTYSIQDTDELQLENLQYGFNWKMGLGVRFPGPVVWGVNYNYQTNAPINSPEEEENFGPFQEKNYWGAFIEYSF